MFLSLFLLYVEVEIYQNKIKVWTICIYLTQTFFLKKRGLKLVSLHHFRHDF